MSGFIGRGGRGVREGSERDEGWTRDGCSELRDGNMEIAAMSKQCCEA